MAIGVIAGDLEDQPPLELIQGQRRSSGRRVLPTLGNAAERRARQQLNRAHHRANQTLDVAAIVRRRHRPVNELDPVFLGRPAQRPRAKLLGVVDVDRIGKTRGRPFRGDAEPRQPGQARPRPLYDERGLPK